MTMGAIRLRQQLPLMKTRTANNHKDPTNFFSLYLLLEITSRMANRTSSRAQIPSNCFELTNSRTTDSEYRTKEALVWSISWRARPGSEEP
jgi:hypothetical protein